MQNMHANIIFLNTRSQYDMHRVTNTVAYHAIKCMTPGTVSIEHSLKKKIKKKKICGEAFSIGKKKVRLVHLVQKCSMLLMT